MSENLESSIKCKSILQFCLDQDWDFFYKTENISVNYLCLSVNKQFQTQRAAGVVCLVKRAGEI